MHYFVVVKHPFYSIGLKMMFRIVSEHFANLRHVKRCKTCVSGLNALFGGTEVVKHPFYSIGPKMMFGSVSEHFTNLRHVKDAKLVFRD
jgi:stress-induced morphogen